jgi:hypothetical protein
MTPSQSLSWRRRSETKKNESGYDDEKKSVQSIIKTACKGWLFFNFFLWKWLCCHMLCYTYTHRKLITPSMSVTNNFVSRWKYNDEFFDHSSRYVLYLMQSIETKVKKNVQQSTVTPGIISQMYVFIHLENSLLNTIEKHNVRVKPDVWFKWTFEKSFIF